MYTMSCSYSYLYVYIHNILATSNMDTYMYLYLYMCVCSRESDVEGIQYDTTNNILVAKVRHAAVTLKARVVVTYMYVYICAVFNTRAHYDRIIFTTLQILPRSKCMCIKTLIFGKHSTKT